MATIHVALDAPTLVAAASELGPGPLVFPNRYPPGSNTPYADLLGVFVYDDDYFGLVLSETVLGTVAATLVSSLGWEDERVSEFQSLLAEGAHASGGGITRSNPQAKFLGGLNEAATAAARGLVGRELASDRIVVTECPNAIRTQTLTVRGVALPPSTAIVALSPSNFLRTVHKVRWQMRRGGGD